MDLKLGIEIGVLLFSMAAAWFALKSQVESMKAALSDISKKLDEDICVRLGQIEDSGVVATAKRVEESVAASQRRIDEHERRLITAELGLTHQSEGFARVEKSITDLAGSLSLQIAGLSRRIDDALRPGRPA